MIGDIYVDVKRHLYTIKWIHRGKRKMTQTKFLITEPQIQLDAGPTTLEEFITKHRKAFA